MHSQLTKILFGAAITALSSSLAAAAASPEVFLGKYCLECHGESKPKADRRFDQLPASIETLDDLERYQEIVDQLNLQTMPPADSLQPTDEERASIIRKLTASIRQTRGRLRTTRRHSVLRRLNAWEYRHTIGDLLGLNVDAWNPAENFPAEVERDGFDNNGEALVTSGILLEHYLDSAEAAIRRATWFGPRPNSQMLSQKSPFYFSGKAHKDLPKLFQLDRFRFTPKTPYTDLYGRHYRGGHIGFLPTARGGLKESGDYTIRVRAAAIDRTHDYGNALGDFRNGDPLVLEIVAVDRKGSVESTGNVSSMTSLKRVELTNEEPQWVEWTGYIDKGYEPEVRFRNGPLAAKRMVRLLTTKAADHEEFKPFVKMKPGSEKAHGVLQAYRGPKLRVWEIQVEGPHVTSWPPHGHQLLYGDLTPNELTRDAIAERLERFARVAFRRAPKPAETAPIQRLVSSKLDEGVEPLTALQLGFQAVLCAPGFLYLSEGDGRLNDHALASRLSYFLWSSMPDDELLKLAEKGQLGDAATLSQQVRRLLGDPRSDRFVSHFIRRWLDAGNIGKMPPSQEFLAYYRDNLELAMQLETHLFFRHVLDNNLPPNELLTADYSFLNRELAAHYGIENIAGGGMQKVSLAGAPRGGITGQGLFLTASANGVDTSPVLRGVYVLEKILGQSPPPPPPDVPEIEPDIRGARTVREELAKHRNITTCAECHRKIDPLGFALENFDAIGGWRDAYAKNLPIDSSGVLPNGDRVNSVADFRRALSQRSDQFTRCLTNKLLAYAIGRELTVADRTIVDSILENMKTGKKGLHDLVTLTVLSDAFRNN